MRAVDCGAALQLVQLADLVQHAREASGAFRIGREVKMLRVEALSLQGGVYPASATAGTARVHEPTVSAREGRDVRTRARQSFAQRGGIQTQNRRRLGCGDLEDFPENVGEPVRPIEAQEHPERAADLHLFEEECRLDASARIPFAQWTGRQPVLEILTKAFEGETPGLDAALAD